MSICANVHGCIILHLWMCAKIFHAVIINLSQHCLLQSSAGEEGGGAFYLITLHTEEGDGRRGKVTFSCSLAQLSHLVTQLRQASRCIQKYANNSWSYSISKSIDFFILVLWWLHLLSQTNFWCLWPPPFAFIKSICCIFIYVSV